MAQNNTIEIDLTLNSDEFKKELQSQLLVARDTGKKLEPLLVQKLELKIDRFQVEVDKAKKKLKELDPLSKEAIELRIDTRRLQKGLTEAKRDLRTYLDTGEVGFSRFNNVIQQANSSIKQMGAYLLTYVSFDRIIAGLRNLSDTFNEFETAFAGFRKTLDASEGEFRNIENAIVDLSKRMPQTVTELSRIAEVGGQMGIGAENIVKFTETVAKLSTAISGVDAETAAQQLARVLSLSGEGIENIDRLGASLVELGNNFKANEGEILNFAERIAGAGGIVGLTSDQILGISTAFVDVGVEAEAGGTAVQKALLTINEAVLNGGQNLANFAKVSGVSAEEFKRGWQEDAGATFAQFVEGLGESGDYASAILSELIGTDVRLQRAFLSVANSGGVLTDAISASSDEFERANALQEEFNKRLQTNDSQLQIQANRWQAWKASVGGSISGVRLAFGEFFLKAIPNAYATVQFFFAQVANEFNKALISLSGGFQIIGTTFKEIGVFLGKNALIIGSNIGEAFNVIPSKIADALNAGIEKVEGFLNKVTKGVSGFAKKLGVDLNLGAVSLGRVDGGGYKAQFKELQAFNVSSIKSINDRVARERAIQGDALKATALRLTEQADITEKSKEQATQAEFNRIKAEHDANMKALSDFLDIEDEKTKGSVGGSKSRADAEKKSIEEIKKYYDDLGKKVDKYNDTIKDGQKLVQDFYKEVTDGAEESQQSVKDLQQEITDLNTELTSLESDRQKDIGDITQDTDVKIAERKIELEKELADLQSRQIQGEDVQSQIQSVQTELSLVNDSVNQEVLDEITAQNNRSVTEQILFEKAEKEKQIQEEFEAEKAKLESELQLKNEALASEQAIYEQIINTKKALETQFTGFLEKEIDKRLDLYSQLETRAQELVGSLANIGFTNRAGLETLNKGEITNINLSVDGIKVGEIQNIESLKAELGEAIYGRIETETNLSSKGIR